MFGSLWLVDGILQLQPMMSVAFIGETITPALIMSAYPLWLASLITNATYAWNLHPLIYDALAATIQIFGGLVLILGPRGFFYKSVVVLSIPWAIIIWIFGEGFGNSLSIGASWIVGSPGSVFFYLVASLVLLNPDRINLKKTFEVGFALLFIIAFLWQVMPQNGYWNGTDLALNNVALSVRPTQFQLLSNFNLDLGLAMYNNPLLYNSLISLSLAVAALLWILIPGRTSVLYTIILSAVTWIAFLDMGGLFTGASTDPNTPIPVIFLALFYLTMIRRSSERTEPEILVQMEPVN